MKTPRRLPCENVSFTLGADAESPGHLITVQFGYSDDGRLVELAFVEAGKIGQGMQMMLAELGLKCSRALQGRQPETGEEIE